MEILNWFQDLVVGSKVQRMLKEQQDTLDYRSSVIATQIEEITTLKKIRDRSEGLVQEVQLLRQTIKDYINEQDRSR